MTNRSSLKSWLVHRANLLGLDVTRDPYSFRLVRAMEHAAISCVIDGGANTGQFGRTLRRAGFAGRIVSFEPQIDAFEELSGWCAADTLWSADRTAIAAETGELTLNVSGNSVSSSLLPMLRTHSDAAPDSRYVSTETVKATTVDSIVLENEIKPSETLLKLDVQGAEEAALRGAKLNLGAFAGILLELSWVPLYEGSWLADEAISFVRSHGYELWMFDPAAFTDPGNGRMLSCDALFLNLGGDIPRAR